MSIDLNLTYFPKTDTFLMVTWIADLLDANPGNLKIGVCFHEVTSQNFPSALDRKNWRKPKGRDGFANVPISDLAYITLGSIWKNGQWLTNLSHSKHKTVVIDIPSQERPLIEASKLFTKYDWNYESFGDSNCLTVQGTLNYSLQMDVIIPSFELARFYWATSSNTFFRDLCQLGISGDLKWPFEEPPIVESPYEVLSNHTLKLNLKHEYADSSAYSLARILGDKEGKRQANTLYRSRQISSYTQKNRQYLGCSFPFSDATRIYAKGKHISINGKPAFLVLEIIQCEHPFPFKHIILNRVKFDVDLEENSRPDPTIPPLPFTIPQKRTRIKSTDAPQNTTKASSLTKLFRNPFAAAKDCTIEVKKQIITKKSPHKNLDYENPSEISSGVKGISDESISPSINGVRITNKKVIDKDKPPSESTKRIIPPHFNEIVESIKNLKKTWPELSWKVIEVIDSETAFDHADPVPSFFPTLGVLKGKKYGKPLHWSYMPNSQTARRCLWVELCYKNNFFYISEWEQRDVNFAIYILQQKNNSAAKASSLYELMCLWPIDQFSRTVTSSAKKGWKRSSIQHPHQEHPESSLELSQKLLLSKLTNKFKEHLSKNTISSI